MGYRLTEQHGDCLAVPQLVTANLARADGDAVRVALYILSCGCTDAKTIAHDLGLKSANAANSAMLWWAGVGLLEKEKGFSGAALPESDPAQKRVDLADPAILADPYVSVLCSEAQTAFGKALGRHEMERLVALYLQEGWKPDVILTCCSEMARRGRPSVASVNRELLKWREAGVETGEDADRYLCTLARRADWCAEVASLFDCAASEFTAWEQRAVTRWQEDWRFNHAMVEEALLHAEAHRTVRYVDGILRAWHAQGKTDVQSVRGKGALVPNNILATGRKPQTGKPSAAPGGPQNWNAIFDDEDTEG